MHRLTGTRWWRRSRWQAQPPARARPRAPAPTTSPTPSHEPDPQHEPDPDHEPHPQHEPDPQHEPHSQHEPHCQHSPTPSTSPSRRPPRPPQPHPDSHVHTDTHAHPDPTPTGTSAPPPGPIGYVQGTSFGTPPVTSTTVSLTKPVQAGDLLVGWFSQYNAPGQVQVSDNVNGTWTRAPASLAYQNDGGDIALYYLSDAKASAGGVQITVSTSVGTYLDGTVAEYSGVALAGALDQVVAARGVGTSVNTGSTAFGARGRAGLLGGGHRPAGRRVHGGQQPGRLLHHARQRGQRLARRIRHHLQRGWKPAGHGHPVRVYRLYAVAATFKPFPANSSPPTTPTGLSATSVAADRVSLQWSASTGSVQGYTVYRNGVAISSTSTTGFLDRTVAPTTSYTYTVAAFNGANQQSAQSSPVQVMTPASSPSFVQGIADSPGSRASSLTLTLSQPVSAGDLLVGWFGEYNAAGQVQVSDNVNGTWTRSASETFSGGTGDIALYYLANSKAAPNGLTVTISASAPAYLQEAIADFSGVSTTAPLDRAVVDSGPAPRRPAVPPRRSRRGNWPWPA